MQRKCEVTHPSRLIGHARMCIFIRLKWIFLTLEKCVCLYYMYICFYSTCLNTKHYSLCLECKHVSVHV